jgi:hypothetical protein
MTGVVSGGSHKETRERIIQGKAIYNDARLICSKAKRKPKCLRGALKPTIRKVLKPVWRKRGYFEVT